MGILFSSSSQVIFGEAIWSLVDLLGSFLDDSPSHATRFGVWFISASVIIAQIGTNISANSVSAGCGLTASFTRFINIRRGGRIAASVGFCMYPWILLKSSNGFTSYLSAYSVFLSSIAGVMVTEYYVIRKGHYDVSDLYATGGGTWYWYTYGLNLRQNCVKVPLDSADNSSSTPPVCIAHTQHTSQESSSTLLASQARLAAQCLWLLRGYTSYPSSQGLACRPSYIMCSIVYFRSLVPRTTSRRWMSRGTRIRDLSMRQSNVNTEMDAVLRICHTI